MKQFCQARIVTHFGPTLVALGCLATPALPQGSVLSETKIATGLGGFGGSILDGDGFGECVAALGDVDRDGVPDIAVGARLDDTAGSAVGAVWILLLNADGSVKSEQKITEGVGGFGGSLAATSNLGRDLAGLGDLDLDGVPDLAVGNQGDNDGGQSTGAL